jgi:peptidoglycan/xylan/chitin deacetylase (PgdA/CDA1 family)
MTRAVVTFHALADDADVLSFAPQRFAQWVRSLVERRIPIVDYHTLLRTGHGVTLTFDDGMRSVVEHAAPVLHEHRVPAHLFLTTGAVGSDNAWPSQPAAAARHRMLTWDEVQRCADHGMLIENHTHSHPDLRTLPADAIAEECTRADDEIARRVGRKPRLFAYPYGQHDTRVRQALAQRYDACLTTRMGYLPTAPDATQVPRIDAYYLRWPWAQAHCLSPAGRAYLGLRGCIRWLRGTR